MSNREEVRQSLKDPEYRREWAGEHVGVGLAFQLRALREDRGWTQTKLGELSRTKQETLSQWENPNYGNYTLKTLKRLAAAYDVGLLVRFVRFGELIDWTLDLTPERLAPPSYDQESTAPRQRESTDGSPSVEDDVFIEGGPVDPIPSNILDFILYPRWADSTSSEGEQFLMVPRNTGTIQDNIRVQAVR